MNDSAPATLTPEQRRRFMEEGFLVLPAALDAVATARFLALVEGLDRRERARRGLGPEAFVEVRNAVAKEHAFLELLDWPSVFPLIVELMGADLQVNTTHSLIRPPQPGERAQEWHRDGHKQIPAVNGTCPWLYTKVGFFLTDLSRPGRGNLRVIPGSHLRADFPGDPAVDPQETVEVTTAPGDVVIFQQRLWHSVAANHGPHPRANIYLGYSQRWLRPIDYLAPDPALLAKATPIRRQLLGEYASECTFWLPKPGEVPLREWARTHAAGAPPAAAEHAGYRG